MRKLHYMKKHSGSHSHMPRSAFVALEPRKASQQSRSVATVEAIYDATIQVLLKSGQDRLTTVHVAERAGVSVGTLYQYFPKQAGPTACLTAGAYAPNSEGCGRRLGSKSLPATRRHGA